MPVKALRLQIIKPHNKIDDPNPLTWEVLGQTLRDLRYAASKMANYVIQQNYAWEFFKQKYKTEYGQYPVTADYKDKLYCYPELSKMFPLAAGQVVNQIEQHAKKVWNTRKAEVLRLHQSVPSFKLDFPIVSHRESYALSTLDTDKNTYLLKVNLTSKSSDRTSYTVIVDAGENSKKAILNRIISGEYRQGALQLVSDRKNKWYCIIPYEFPAQQPELNPDRVMGIDLGITKAVYWAFNHSLKRGSIDGNEIEEFRRRVQARRKSIQHQGKYCGDGRIGHGRKRRLQPIEVLQEKEANFRATTNHRYARCLVDTALKNQCAAIQMEDLTGINENSTFLKNWTYYDLQTKIKQKAAEVGIQVRLIDPQYTSQRCSHCGHIDRNNRPSQAIFCCSHCGYGDHYHCLSCGKNQGEPGNCHHCGSTVKHTPVNADYNAAKNIATPDIEQLIAQTISGTATETKSMKKKRANLKQTG